MRQLHDEHLRYQQEKENRYHIADLRQERTGLMRIHAHQKRVDEIDSYLRSQGE